MTDKLDLRQTALVIVDLQDNILDAQPLYPRDAQQVLAANNQLVAALKNTPALIALVGVKMATFRQLYPFVSGPDERDLDHAGDDGKLALEIANDADATNVVKITKHNPGAFFGTDLDLQLRRHGIQNIILTGVSTSNGVYATALDAFQNAYQLIVVEDACADRKLVRHQFFFDEMFDRLGTVTTLAELLPRLQ
ncbi:cysteine hydrolase [Lactiplantibacillus fabifermentans]|uniref:Isochorismatase family protein n=2 Tax=Lactiplantibacillus fabifermentans TaxID=483011 RepID=A0A0R2NV22_9LACO|nr:cysteine hydrolase [Lactiplantibacillus fabifermentans]ETY74562.1 isochorismatase [Lactiplantibacillus fabifermentans T30PCM01]KRO27683.1 isochorismatase family protein [Lactiplantibacillus fabifermentans DSM 21115]